MTTLWLLNASKMDGRVRLSCGSADSQTAQWHASVGTPMEVPDPSTVSRRADISKRRAETNFDSSLGGLSLTCVTAATELLAFGLLGHGFGSGLRNFHEGQLQAA